MRKKLKLTKTPVKRFTDTKLEAGVLMGSMRWFGLTKKPAKDVFAFYQKAKWPVHYPLSLIRVALRVFKDIKH